MPCRYLTNGQENAHEANAGSGPCAKQQKMLQRVLVFGNALHILPTILLYILFYRSLERDISMERSAYLTEILQQAVMIIGAVSDGQWEFAQLFAHHLKREPPFSKAQLTELIAEEQQAFEQDGFTLFVFDDRGNYHDALGTDRRWSSSDTSIAASSPMQQV